MRYTQACVASGICREQHMYRLQDMYRPEAFVAYKTLVVLERVSLWPSFALRRLHALG